MMKNVDAGILFAIHSGMSPHLTIDLMPKRFQRTAVARALSLLISIR